MKQLINSGDSAISSTNLAITASDCFLNVAAANRFIETAHRASSSCVA
jgi:hypothetical protein